MKIKNVYAREILDSRGFPTVECNMFSDAKVCVTSSVPAGASVGNAEAMELRDGDPDRFFGKGVKKAVANINEKIAPLLINKEPELFSIDKELIAFDGTKNKSNLGANAILATSICIAKLQALSDQDELFELVRKLTNTSEISVPKIVANLLNGGVHADNNLIFQEFSVIPIAAKTVDEMLQIIFLIYNNLKSLLLKDGLATTVGDEGGFGPSFYAKNSLPEKEALNYLLRASNKAGFNSTQIVFAIDVAASQFFDKEKKLYKFHERNYSSSDLIDLYTELIETYPIYILEDGLSEDDWIGWSTLNKKLGTKLLVVGDDLFTTNPQRIQKGFEEKAANSVIIKPNQIGTLSETFNTIKLCNQFSFKTIVSHRSGETLDDFIVDLALGCASPFMKIGACARGERIAKYNRILKIGKNIN